MDGRKASILEIRQNPRLAAKKVQRSMKLIAREEKATLAELKKNSKSLDQLVVTEDFVVEEVLVRHYVASHTPDSEIAFGCSSPVYQTGYTTKTRLKVHHYRSSIDKEDIIVHLLNFEGFTATEAGDYIHVKIPKYKEENFGGITVQDAEPFYLPRDFNLEEMAIEIKKFKGMNNTKVLRIERAANYSQFLKD